MAFPNIPNLPGVPPLPRLPGAAQFLQPILMVADLVGGALDALFPPWGVFRGPVRVLTPDNITAFSFRKTWTLADFTLEQGGFESYDKVETPFQTRVRMSVGGNISRRQDFLSQIEQIAGDLQLYDVVTPERIYPSVNIVNYDYDRRAVRGAGMLEVDVWLTEVRMTAQTQFTDTRSASGSSPVNNGTVQTEAPTSAQNTTLSSAFPAAFPESL